MARFTGRDLYMEWVYSGGTVTLSGDQTTVSWSPSVSLYDAGAADDSWTTRVVGIKDFTVSWTARIDQTSYVSVEDSLLAGNIGTLYVYPWGTAATGKRKYTFPSVCQGAASQWPYNNVVEMNSDFVSYGSVTFGTT